MRIALVGNFSSDDEGMAKTAHRYADNLENEHEVIRVDLVGSSIPHNLEQVRRANLDVIHYVPGPSRQSFLFTKLASWLTRDALIVHSGMHPKPTIGPSVIYQHVDLLLHQSEHLANRFDRAGIRTVPLASGVDVDRFNQVAADEKRALKERYDLPADDDIVLHVGHINTGRRVETLANLPDNGTSVLLIGSERNSDPELVEDLRDQGCHVVTEYQPHIEELYQLADVYAFTVPPENELSSINVPLSILEALATGLPVASTRYGALQRFFEDSPAIKFADTPQKLDFKTREALTNDYCPTKIRETATEYSWERIGTKLSEEYTQTFEEIYGTS